MKYRKKPNIVDVFKWDSGIPEEDYPHWLRKAMQKPSTVKLLSGLKRLLIQTEELVTIVPSMMYIVREVDGYIWACPPDVFESLYDHLTNYDGTEIA